MQNNRILVFLRKNHRNHQRLSYQCPCDHRSIGKSPNCLDARFLLKEAEFYGIEGMADKIREELQRKEAYENHMREHCEQLNCIQQCCQNYLSQIAEHTGKIFFYQFQAIFLLGKIVSIENQEEVFLFLAHLCINCDISREFLDSCDAFMQHRGFLADMFLFSL